MTKRPLKYKLFKDSDKKLLLNVLRKGLSNGLLVRTAVSIKPITAEILDAIESDKANFKILPYLRSKSSMTKDEEETECYLRTYAKERYADWCYNRHLDIDDLIEKGLALEALEDMYK